MSENASGTTNLLSPPQSPPLSLDDADAVDKVKAQSRGRFLHVKLKVSEVKCRQFSKQCPSLFDALRNELPWNFCHWEENGIGLSERIYRGIRRNGPKYLWTWLEENHIELSENGLMIASALEFYHAFTTYDELMEYLRDNNWGELRTDKTGPLDIHPTYSKEEEPKPVILEKKKIDEQTISYYATQNKITPIDARKHFQELGYEIIPFRRR